jgi:hypothetical protein
MSSPPTPTPVVYPVDDMTRSQAERDYLQKLAQHAATQDLTQDVRGYVQDISIAFTVFAAVFVLLRFIARWRQAARIAIDDWLIVASLVVLVGNMVMNLMLVKLGLGLHSGVLTLEELQRLDEVCLFVSFSFSFFDAGTDTRLRPSSALRSFMLPASTSIVCLEPLSCTQDVTDNVGQSFRCFSSTSVFSPSARYG